MKDTKALHRVVVIGGGFAGLHAVKSLRRAAVQVKLLDRRNYHLFQPLLYQVATGGLSPANIAAPLRTILKRQRNAQVLMAEVLEIDVANRQVLVRAGDAAEAADPRTTAIGYDTLVVACGVSHNYFGHDAWEAFAPGLKTIEDATRMRARILKAFEQAERETDPAKVRQWLTFVVVGGGPTGVELAGALAEIARYTLKHEFRSIDPAHAQILLLEGSDRFLRSYPTELSSKARASLTKLGVTTRIGAQVIDITPVQVTIRVGDQTEVVPTRTVLWAAGVRASPLGQVLAKAAQAELDRFGRVRVEPDLSLKDHPELFVIGDLSNFPHQTGEPLPGLAPVAMQQGRYVAKLIQARLRGAGLPPFHYRNPGSMATIGRKAAVADFGKLKFAGLLAWLAWLFVHLTQLVQFQNRVLVFLQWGWNYFTRNRAARLITESREP